MEFMIVTECFQHNLVIEEKNKNLILSSMQLLCEKYVHNQFIYLKIIGKFLYITTKILSQ